MSENPINTASVDSTANGTATEPNGTTTAPNGSAAANLQSAKDTVVNNASAAMNSISNSQTVQDLKNGPVAQSVSEQASKTGSEFQDLANARQTPATTAANGQTLTNYHSFFYRLLSWQNPRATAVTFATSILFIFAARYLNILRYFFKFSFIILGVTSALEIAGKLLFDDGLASKMRPRKYWTIPRDSLERMLDDVEQLINFFVIESQRILYAENVYATLAVFTAAFLSYWLIKLVPFWGLSLISTCVIYLAPLVYIKNQEAIDGGLNHAGELINTQASQLRQLTAQRTSDATNLVQSYAGEYTSKAQEYMGSKKTTTPATTSNPQTVSSSDFPAAPQQTPTNTGSPAAPTKVETEPLISH